MTDTTESKPNDESLVRDVINGNTDAYGQLIDRYAPRLVRYGRKFLADSDDVEDIVQDVFIRAYEHIQAFNPSQRFSPWIYRIAHNCFVNALRARARGPVFSIDLDTLVATPLLEESGISEAEQREIREMLDTGLAKIEPKYREVLVLYYLEELSYKDIADILAVPIGTVGIRLSRARAALRPHIDSSFLDS